MVRKSAARGIPKRSHARLMVTDFVWLAKLWSPMTAVLGSALWSTELVVFPIEDRALLIGFGVLVTSGTCVVTV